MGIFAVQVLGVVRRMPERVARGIRLSEVLGGAPADRSSTKTIVIYRTPRDQRGGDEAGTRRVPRH